MAGSLALIRTMPKDLMQVKWKVVTATAVEEFYKAKE